MPSRRRFAEGVFEVINVTPDGVSSAIADPRIAAVTLTGSVRAGMAIGAQAGAALKKCVLELGGSDPFIVLNDADLDAAVQAAVIGRYQNSGQVCAAAKRLIIASVVEAFTANSSKPPAAEVGDPLAADTYIGPMARFDLRDELDGQVRDTWKKAPPCCWAAQGRRPGNLLRADRAGRRHRHDLVQAGAVRPGGLDHHRPRCRPRRGPGQRQRVRPDHHLHRRRALASN
jgi:succinate-semialdehyde dehydrogenase